MIGYTRWETLPVFPNTFGRGRSIETVSPRTPIDPDFEDSREIVEGQGVWGPVDEPETPGIHGTHVAVDFDLCIADGARLEDCPVDVFEWTDTPGHPESEIEADPVLEPQCIDCTLRVDVRPGDATDVDPGRAGRI